jgi:vacuolar protein sorting-associated protein 29
LLEVLRKTHDLPAKFKKLVVPGTIQHIPCTGNVCDGETFDYLRGIANEALVVKGEWNTVRSLLSSTAHAHILHRCCCYLLLLLWALDSPSHRTPPPPPHLPRLTTQPPPPRPPPGHLSTLRPGKLSSLFALARQLHVDVLVSGGTHELRARESKGRFSVDPGSPAGA